MIERMDDPIASEFTAATFSKYRSERMTGKWGRETIVNDKVVKRKPKPLSLNTLNHDLAYCNAFINDLIKSKNWAGNNPLDAIDKFKIDESELIFLSKEQIKDLLKRLDILDKKTAVATRVALATGARWSEATGIKPSQIVNCKITYIKTKSFKSRTIPISHDLEQLILENLPLSESVHYFRKAITDLKIYLPDGQLTHVLRHTFASHYMMNKGDIITLQHALGHSSLKMTMRYAHLSPSHLADIPNLNPLANLDN